MGNEQNSYVCKCVFKMNSADAVFSFAVGNERQNYLMHKGLIVQSN